MPIRKGDSLIWTEPTTGAKIPVTAASDEQDGMVVINQKGAFSPCPVTQLEYRRDISSSDQGIAGEASGIAPTVVVGAGHAEGHANVQSVTLEGATFQASATVTPPPSFVIVWDPEIISEDEYADLVTALGDIVRASGGAGIQRIKSRGFGVPCEAGVTL